VLSSLKNLDWYRFLARPQLPSPPEHLLDALNQQPILITGAGGSIGSALALRLRKIGPPKLVLLEASESNLYALERDCATAGATKPIVPILGSTADEALLEEIFVTHAPRLVFHTAAFKHVPLMEAQPLAAIANNIFATETVTKVAAAHGARVVLLSTDKAVAPASIMGATKRVAEQIVLTGGGIALRLGNVLASHDSVTEIFARQIERDGPITVTDPAARRYFLTLDEAVDLLLTAAGRREPSALLAPVLPTAHFIADLARFMVHELAPDREIAIEFAGSRPGDKESEKLWSAGDRISAASLEGMVVVESALLSEAQRNGLLASLQAALDVRDLAAALAHLRALVPDYTPTRTVLTLASQCRPRVCL
jgi:FlaA1/EpsC-like NDP-sugar epimerase